MAYALHADFCLWW